MHVLTLDSIGVRKNQYGSLIAKTQRVVYSCLARSVAKSKMLMYLCEKIDFLIAPEKPEFSAVIARHFWTSIGCIELWCKCSYGFSGCLFGTKVSKPFQLFFMFHQTVSSIPSVLSIPLFRLFSSVPYFYLIPPFYHGSIYLFALMMPNC